MKSAGGLRQVAGIVFAQERNAGKSGRGKRRAIAPGVFPQAEKTGSGEKYGMWDALIRAIRRLCGPAGGARRFLRKDDTGLGIRTPSFARRKFSLRCLASSPWRTTGVVAVLCSRRCRRMEACDLIPQRDCCRFSRHSPLALYRRRRTTPEGSHHPADE